MPNEKQARGPLLHDLDPADTVDPSQADPIVDTDAGSDGQLPRLAMQAARPRSRMIAVLAGSLGGLVSLAIGLWTWDFLLASLARSPVLGAVVAVLVAVVSIALLAVSLREVAAIGRLRRVDRLRHSAEEALTLSDTTAARETASRLARLYRSRADLGWQRAQTEEAIAEALDADAILVAAERGYMAPLDVLARTEIENAARKVAAATALVPLAFADVLVAMVTNLSMIRRIAEIYGGRAGVIGSWRLFRAVFSHLVATGAIAIGDDLIGSVAGGSLLSKVSRRFGEGVINGALTARVGVAAMEVCRPLPFQACARPSVSGIIGRSVSGLFSKSSR